MNNQVTSPNGKKREYSPSPDRQSKVQEPLSPNHEHGTKRRKAIPARTTASQVLAANQLFIGEQSEAHFTADQAEFSEQESSAQTISILDQLSERIEKLEGVQRMQSGNSVVYRGEEEQQIKALKEVREMLYSMAGCNDDLMETS